MTSLVVLIILGVVGWAVYSWHRTKGNHFLGQKESAGSLTTENFRALVARQPFSDFLPHLNYDSDHQAYMTSDGLGFVFEAAPLSNTGTDTWQQLKSLYEIDFPANTSISFMMYASPHIRPVLGRWCGARGGEINFDPDALGFGTPERRAKGIFSTMARRQYAFLERGIHEPMYPGLEMRFRNFRLIISVKIPGIGRPEELKMRIDRMEQVRSAVMQQFKTMGLIIEPMEGTEMVRLLSELINPGNQDVHHLRYDENREIRKQVIFAQNRISIGKKFLQVNDAAISLQTVKQYPSHFPLWEMANLLGDQNNNNKQIPCPFALTFNMLFPDQEGTKKFLQITAGKAKIQGQGSMAKFIPKLALKDHNFDIVMRNLESGGRIVQAYHQLLLFGRDETEAEKATQSARALFQGKGFVLQQDNYISAPLFVQALPLGYRADIQKDLMRTHTMTSQAAANLTPVEADSKGTRTPTVNLGGRRGHLSCFDIFDNVMGGNFNAVIAAASGSGKSVFVQYLVYCYLSVMTRVRIIDVGRSYEKMARLFSGLFIEFGPKANICLNPFSKLTRMDAEELKLLTPLIAQMASPSRPMSDWEKNVLERTIQRVFERMGNETSIDALAETLEEHPDQRAKDIGIQLFSYTSRGRRGRYFTGKNNVDLDNRLVVLELEELKSDPELQLVVLQVYLYNINQSVYLSDRKTKTLVIVDEAWQLFDGGSTGEFFDRSYRQFRKYNAAAMTVTQGINDFYKNPATRACIENSDWTFLLRQKPESIAALKESKRLIIPEHEYETLSSIHTITGQYSEVYVVGPSGRFVGRLFIDPFSYWIYTTNAQDNALLFTFFDAYNGNRELAIQSCVESNGLYRQLLKEGKTTDQAIGVCMNRYFRKDQAIREPEAAHA